VLKIKSAFKKLMVGLVFAGLATTAAADLEKIKQRGELKVGVYLDNFPFSDKDMGIDIDIAKAIAAKLGLKAGILPFPAGENLNDDLRNMVWKGHYLGYGPADILMHVPVDKELMARNDKVEIFAPYYRDSLRIAINKKSVGQWSGLDGLLGKSVGVEKVSLGAWVLMSEESGKYRDTAKIFESVPTMLEQFKAGKLDAIVTFKSQAEAAVMGNNDFEIVPASFQRGPRQGTPVGVSVKRDNLDLARAVQLAMNELVAEGVIKSIFEKHNVAPVSP